MILPQTLGETKASMSTPRCSLSANVVDGKIYLIGGDAQGSSTTTTVNINEVYDPSTDSWTSASAIPSAVDNYASAVAYDRIYVIGGSYGNEVSGENLNQIYDPETNTWSQGAPFLQPLGMQPQAQQLGHMLQYESTLWAETPLKTQTAIMPMTQKQTRGQMQLQCRMDAIGLP